MTDPSLRRLALADLDPETLERLILHGEDLFVDRKLQPPAPPKFGAEVASFANTMGGWLLLGVKDDRTIDDGYVIDEQLDLQSHLAAVLRKEIDPLPPFVAEMFEHDGKPVGVMRIFESADAPHIVRGTGAVYVRSSKGKEPVDDHRTLLAIAQKGEQAEARARELMSTLPAVARLLGPTAEPTEIVFSARAAPVTMNPAASDWVLTRAGADAVTASVETLLPGPPAPSHSNMLSLGGRQGPDLLPFGRAIAARIQQHWVLHGFRTATVIADSGGVFGAQFQQGPAARHKDEKDEPVEHTVLLNAILDSELRPLARCLADLLKSAEVYGRALFDLAVALPPTTTVYEAGMGKPPPDPLFTSGQLTIPADDDEVYELAEYWHRELQRQLGVVKFEGEPETARP
jgi:hypothetical protein